MNYSEYERSVRHKMCILLSLETLAICVLMCMLVINETMGGWHRIYLRERHPAEGIIILIILVMVPVAFTVASLYSEGIYIAYEILHCVVGAGFVILLLGYYAFFEGIIIFLILTLRFWIYLFAVHAGRQK